MKDLTNIFENIINIEESVTKHKLTGSKYSDIIISAFIDFWLSHLKISNTKARVMITRVPKGLGGYIDMAKVSENSKDNLTLKIDKNMGLKFMLIFIGHEMTHAKQIIRSELWYTKEDILWKGKQHTTIKYLKSLTNSVKKISKNMDEYNNLPWEVEAKRNESICIDLFKESKQYETLLSMGDETLNYIVKELL